MKKPKSKVGLVLSAIYIVFTLCVLIYGLICNEWLCMLVIVFPAFPWFYLWAPLMRSSGGDELYLLFFLWTASIILNGFIIYQIGKLIGRVFPQKTLP